MIEEEKNEELNHHKNGKQVYEFPKKKKSSDKILFVLLTISFCYVLPIIGGLIWAMVPNWYDITQVYVWILFGIGAGFLTIIFCLILLILLIKRVVKERQNERKYV